VAGVDVMVSRFETDLLGRLPSLDQPFLLVNDDDRVVLSTSPWCLVGSLLPSAAIPPGAGTQIAGVPWRLCLVGPDGRLDGA
jgi:hypothetical protein